MYQNTYKPHYFASLMENRPNKNYDVFRLAQANSNSPSYTYVAKKHLIERIDGAEELHNIDVSGLGIHLVDYHLKYLKGHPCTDENSVSKNHVSCFEVNINYAPPYHIRLNQDNILEVKEFTTAEKKEFLQSIQSRLTEYWESDEII